MTYCPLISQTLIIISVKCILLVLRSKTLMLPTTLIYSCQLVGTVNPTLPFTKSVKNFFFISTTFCSWVATSSPNYCVFISKQSDVQDHAPFINILFWGTWDFPISSWLLHDIAWFVLLLQTKYEVSFFSVQTFNEGESWQWTDTNSQHTHYTKFIRSSKSTTCDLTWQHSNAKCKWQYQTVYKWWKVHI